MKNKRSLPVKVQVGALPIAFAFRLSGMTATIAVQAPVSVKKQIKNTRENRTLQGSLCAFRKI